MIRECKFLCYSQEEDVATITLDRPPVNVLDIAMLREFDEVLEMLAADDEMKLLVLTGKGRMFSAGVDVADHTAERVGVMIEVFHSAIGRLLSFGCPVVAALNGPALGGGFELAMACDVILASTAATVGQPEIRLGVFPPAAAAILPRLIGRQRALDLLLTGRIIEMEEAARIGLVSRTAPPDQFQTMVDDYVAELASLSRPVLRLAKKAVVAGLEIPLAQALSAAERNYLDELMRLRDPQEGLTAFLEKREPHWVNA